MYNVFTLRDLNTIVYIINKMPSTSEDVTQVR